MVGALVVISGAPPPNPHQPALANLRTSQPLKTATRAKSYEIEARAFLKIR